MALAVGDQLLGGRYRIVKGPVDSDGLSETWVVESAGFRKLMAKTWAFNQDAPDDVARVLWDQEVRFLYRVASSPEADQWLVTLEDASIDRVNKCFVMVLAAPGQESLERALRDRPPWLTGLEDVQVRLELWRALLRLARGLSLLHQQQLMHRNVSARTIYFDALEGADSLRLGGFEWSVRQGVPASEVPPLHIGSPPEFFKDHRVVRFTPETDWFGFGVVAARCFVDAGPPPDEARESVALAEYGARLIGLLDGRPPGRPLFPDEVRLLKDLIAEEPRLRKDRGKEIIVALSAQVSRLQTIAAGGRPTLLAVLHRDELRFFADRLDLPLGPDGFNPGNREHRAKLCAFIEKDLIDGIISRRSQEPLVQLQGARHCYLLDLASQSDQDWNRAWIRRLTTPWAARPGLVSAPVEPGSVKVVVDPGPVPGRPQGDDWTPWLPRQSDGGLPQPLRHLHDFMRLSNQIDLLIRASSVFAFVADEPEMHGVDEWLVLREDRQANRPVDWLVGEQSMHRSVEDEIAGSGSSRQVHLLPPGPLRLETRVPYNAQQWTVDDIDPVAGTVRVRRHASKGQPAAPRTGYLRTPGLFGQLELIRRRRDAIERARSHTYLLRALAAPAQVYMDVEDVEPLDLREDKLDVMKRAVINDIFRVRPIYALQGPPGTGKTTLVAWLLREILTDDPVAQVLVAAQGHGAVDVLRRRLKEDNVFEGEWPLTVRLKRKEGSVGSDRPLEPGSAEELAHRLLSETLAALAEVPSPTAIQARWAKRAATLVEALAEGGRPSEVQNLCELVKRSCHITFSTAGSADLEALAITGQDFDWSILEEAGQAHVADLALPLQLGHRWLLIGDQRQLPPYRMEVHQRAFENVNRTVASLEALASSPLVDADLIQTWSESTTEDRARFMTFASGRWKVFEAIFKACEDVHPEDDDIRRTRVTAPGERVRPSAAGMLTHQHRMHRDIGTLVSEVFYDGSLEHETNDEDGRPTLRVRHMLQEPDWLVDRAIVWLDLPPAWEDLSFAESSSVTGRGGYRNRAEADAVAALISSLRPRPVRPVGEDLEIAVLSPYTAQVSLLLDRLRNVQLPSGLAWRRDVESVGQVEGAAVPAVHTVDSFQGNEADIVVVSLVRNRIAGSAENPIGFLDQPERPNVLLSRARRLLVVVGSFDFFERAAKRPDLAEAGDRDTWRRLTTLLREWFDDTETAVRVSATQLVARR